MHNVFLIMNLLASLASAFWAAAALARPSRLSGTAKPGDGEIFYCRLYAARSLPLEILVAIAPLASWSRPVAALVLLASIVQLNDMVIAAAEEKWNMLVDFR